MNNSKIKRISSMLLCGLLAASLLAGCGSGTGSGGSSASSAASAASGSSAAASSKHLNVSWHAALKTLDNVSSSSWEPNRLGIVETLTRISPDKKLIPWLAKSWEHTDDKTWVFHLQDGVKFSNGKACDGEAVKAALMRVAETPRAKTMLKIDSIDVKGLDVTIKTKDVNAALPNNLADYIAVIWDVSTVEGENPTPVGTGPFAITSWDHNAKMELAANKDYWGGKPKLDTVSVTVIADGNAQAMALDNGEVDLNFQLPTENVRQFEGNDKFTINKTVGSRCQIVYFNLKNEFLSDIAVRKAITLATDREALANVVNKGDSEAATAIFPVSFDFGKVEGIKYNVDEAKKVLSDAGYKDSDNDGILEKNGKPIKLRYITYGSHGSLLPTFAEAMQDALKQIGISVEISLNEYAAHTDLLKAGDFDLALNSFIMASALDPQYSADILLRTGADYNYGKYSSAKVDELVKQLDAEFDTAKRVQLALDMQKQVVEDCAFLTLGHLKFQVVGNAKVSGYETQGTELYLLTKDTDIK